MLYNNVKRDRNFTPIYTCTTKSCVFFNNYTGGVKMTKLFQSIYATFLSLNCLDRVLLLILFFSLLFKLLGEVVCWLVSKNFNKDKMCNKPCIYLESKKKHDCKIPKCKVKYFINEQCNKKKCPGYRTSDFAIEEIKSINKWPFIILTACKWISDLSAVLLIIRTLLNSVT